MASLSYSMLAAPPVETRLNKIRASSNAWYECRCKLHMYGASLAAWQAFRADVFAMVRTHYCSAYCTRCRHDDHNRET